MLPIVIELGLNKEPPLLPIFIALLPTEFVKFKSLHFNSDNDKGLTNDKLVAVIFPLKIQSLLKVFAVVPVIVNFPFVIVKLLGVVQ